MLNPVEAQLNRLKDRYIPDLAKEMMLEDNVYKDDFENREEQDVSQEYIDQAKGTVESEPTRGQPHTSIKTSKILRKSLTLPRTGLRFRREI